MHGNRFTNFPCSIAYLQHLEEFSLEWFLYARPPKPKFVKKGSGEGTTVFDRLRGLCELLIKFKMQECALVTFLENYSDDNYKVN